MGTALPSSTRPSDHLSLVATFMFREVAPDVPAIGVGGQLLGPLGGPPTRACPGTLPAGPPHIMGAAYHHIGPPPPQEAGLRYPGTSVNGYFDSWVRLPQ